MRRVVADATRFVFTENVVRKAIDHAAEDLEAMGYQLRALACERDLVLTTYGSGTGFALAPTTTANYCCPSMQKWPNCREFARVFGQPSPTNHEWLMAWPIGWTDSLPPATDRFRLWQQRHGKC